MYRAVINLPASEEPAIEPHTKHEGPYPTPGQAQGRITFWENYLRDADSGQTEVQEGTITWAPYIPKKKRGGKGGRA
ncbi:hypothetical protein ACFT38_28400 [Streptomyces sp. NPDC056975]|uniref:hypothetical protein n=1 Tax=Streptomyces sp. NPDC056975 TaxID=3345985 RepID=UPI0036334CCB